MYCKPVERVTINTQLRYKNIFINKDVFKKVVKGEARYYANRLKG